MKTLFCAAAIGFLAICSADAKVPFLPSGWVLASADATTKTRTFVSPDGHSKLVTNQTPVNRDLSSDMDAIAHRSGERITYQRRGRSWIAVSGFKGDQIFYRKSNLACGGTRWHNIEFTYPAASKRQMDKAVTTMARAMTLYSDDC
jgi:serine/threonine-protein kinase